MEAAKTMPSILNEDRLTAMPQRHLDLVFMQLDKNSGKVVVVCKKLYVKNCTVRRSPKCSRTLAHKIGPQQHVHRVGSAVIHLGE